MRFRLNLHSVVTILAVASSIIVTMIPAAPARAAVDPPPCEYEAYFSFESSVGPFADGLTSHDSVFGYNATAGSVALNIPPSIGSSLHTIFITEEEILSAMGVSAGEISLANGYNIFLQAYADAADDVWSLSTRADDSTILSSVNSQSDGQWELMTSNNAGYNDGLDHVSLTYFRGSASAVTTTAWIDEFYFYVPCESVTDTSSPTPVPPLPTPTRLPTPQATRTFTPSLAIQQLDPIPEALVYPDYDFGEVPLPDIGRDDGEYALSATRATVEVVADSDVWPPIRWIVHTFAAVTFLVSIIRMTG